MLTSPKSTQEDAHIFSAFPQHKILKFYQSSSHNEANPPKFLIKKNKDSRLLTSQTIFRAQTNIISPLSRRLSSKSSLFNPKERPFSTVSMNRTKHPKSDINILTFDSFNQKMIGYSKEKSVKSAIRKTFSIFHDVNISNLDTPNMEFPNDLKILTAYGSNSMKSPCNDDDNASRLTRKNENIKKNIENMRKETSFNKFHPKISLDNDCQVFWNVLAQFHEKCNERYVLLPSIEGELFNQFLDLESYFLKLFGLFYEALKTMTKELIDQNLEYQRVTEDFSTMKSRNSEMLKKQIDRIYEQNKKDLSLMIGNMEKHEICLNFENVKLEKELTELQKNLCGRMDVNEIIEEFRNFKNLNEIQLQKKNMTIKAKEDLLNKLTYQLNTMKAALIRNERDSKLLQKENNDLKNFNQELNEQLVIIKEKMMRYKETALMQKEDTEGVNEKNTRLLKTINILNEKMNEIKKKIGQNIEKIGLVTDSEESYKDSMLFQDITSFMTQKFARILSKHNLSNEDFDNFSKQKGLNPINDSPMMLSTIQRESITSKLQTRITEFEESLNQIILPKYQYYKPSFLSLIQNGRQIFEKKTNNFDTNHAENNISTKFLSTLRGILDSKYNEFIIYQDYKSFSKFPEFVYSWLNTYEIHEESRLIKEICIEKSSDPNEILLSFINSLYNPLGMKLWECQNFKEFLEERSSIDELFFFLHCRFLLNRGPTLLKDGASFSYIHYVLYYYAEMIVDLVLKHFDEETKGFIKARLREKAKGKNKKLFIDVSFVLKIMLEYYRLERKQKFHTIKDLFKILLANKIQNKKIIITEFDTFKIFMSKIYPKTTELEKAELFRECWQISNGEITPEIAFTVLTESNFFISTLKLRSLMNLSISKINERLPVKTILNKENYMKSLDFFNEKFKNEEKLQNFFQALKSGVIELGLERIWSGFEFNWRIFSDKYKFIDLTEFSGKTPDLIFSRMNELINQIRSIRVFHNHFYEEENLENEWNLFKNAFEGFDERINKEKIKWFEKNNKAKKLQGFIQKRVSKWYILMNNLLNKMKNKK